MTTENTAVKTETTEAKKPVSEKVAAKRAAEKALRASVKPNLSADAKVKTLRDNPKRGGSKAAAVFARYAGEPTVKSLYEAADKGEIKAADGEVVPASYVRACLMWDVRHGFISLG